MNRIHLPVVVLLSSAIVNCSKATVRNEPTCQGDCTSPPAGEGARCSSDASCAANLVCRLGACEPELIGAPRLLDAPLYFPTPHQLWDHQIVDLDDDGNLDAVAAASGSTTAVIAFMGDGQGGFSQTIVSDVGVDLRGIATGDFDANGTLDAVVADHGADELLVLSGAGDGTFTAATSIPVTAPWDVEVAELNGDSELDLVAAKIEGEAWNAFVGGAGFGFTSASVSNSSYRSEAVAVGDLDGDAVADIVSPNAFLEADVYRGNGDGTFAYTVTVPTGDTPRSIDVGDVDGDDAVDIVTSGLNSNEVHINWGVGDGSFDQRTPTSLQTAASPFRLAMADSDGDGNLDFVTDGSRATAIFGLGGVQFSDMQIIPLDPGTPQLADLNGDGTMDLTISNAGIGVLFGRPGRQLFESPATLTVGRAARAVELVDLNADGHLDLVSGHEHEGFRVLLGDGVGRFEDHPTSISTSGAQSLVVFDANGDGNLDVIQDSPTTSSLTVALGDGTGGFTEGTPVDVGSTSYGLRVGDLNGDGPEDLVVLAIAGVVPLVGNGDGTFLAAATFAAAGVIPETLTLADLNGDGALDLAYAINDATREVRFASGNGDGSFGAITTVSTIDYAEGLAAGDFDGDMDMDIAVSSDGELLVFVQETAGAFAPKAASGISSTYLRSADVNDDGVLDLVAGPTVRVLLGQGDGTFELDAAYACSAYRLAVGDVTGDGRKDVVSFGYSERELFVLQQR